MDNFEYIERLPSEDADWSDDDWRILRACLETHLSIMKRFSSMLAMAI